MVTQEEKYRQVLEAIGEDLDRTRKGAERSKSDRVNLVWFRNWVGHLHHTVEAALAD